MDITRRKVYYLVIVQGKVCGSGKHDTFSLAVRRLMRHFKRMEKKGLPINDATCGVETVEFYELSKPRHEFMPASQCVQWAYRTGNVKNFTFTGD